MSEEPAPLAEVFESLGRVLTSSSRDWGEYWADAWLYGVLVGWDCEDDHQHDAVCGGDAAIRELAAKHKWDDGAVARLRRYRAVVRTAGAEQPPPLLNQLRHRVQAEGGRWDSKRMLDACRDAGHHVTVQRARLVFRHLAEANPDLLVKAEGTRWSYDTVPTA